MKAIDYIADYLNWSRTNKTTSYHNCDVGLVKKAFGVGAWSNYKPFKWDVLLCMHTPQLKRFKAVPGVTA